MNQLNQKNVEVKEEEGADLQQLEYHTTIPNSERQSNPKNYTIDPMALLKNHFDPYYSYNYWMSQTGMTYPYHPYYAHTDPYFGNHPYNMTEFMSRSNKQQQNNNFMAQTTDLLKSTPFLPSYIPPSSHPFLNPHQINQIKRNVFVDDSQQMEHSDDSPVIKEEEQSVKNSAQQRKLGEKRLKAKMKNETKNIPKNYGKAMITFILSHLDWIQSQFGIEKRQDLIAELKKRKNSINAIVHLKQLWTTSKYAKEFRILSGLFLRKYSFAYIFNSRVSNYSTHIKYKYKLQQALKSPGNFSRIKQF